jgi:(p)ppGpp synthase/HD superfamily hydrolase
VWEDRGVEPAGLASFLDDLPVARRAAAVAAEAHAGQTRPVDGAPFIVHPLEVALNLRMCGCDDEVVAAGVLHDAVEKGGVTIDGVRKTFGERVARLVDAVTDDAAIAERAARKAALREHLVARGGADGVAVFAADQLAKARELRLAAASDAPPERDVAARRGQYLASLALIEDALPGHPLAVALRFELAAQTLIPALAWMGPAVPIAAGP